LGTFVAAGGVIIVVPLAACLWTLIS
jgi:hypothetical protein